MSYTIPDSVQTKAEAVLAVASAIADEDMGARYDGTVNTSLDVLADVLAAQDVDVPQTNAGAILALAQYAHGGGGGGGGELVEVTIAFVAENENGILSAIPDEDIDRFPPFALYDPVYSMYSGSPSTISYTMTSGDDVSITDTDFLGDTPSPLVVHTRKFMAPVGSGNTQVHFLYSRNGTVSSLADVFVATPDSYDIDYLIAVSVLSN